MPSCWTMKPLGAFRFTGVLTSSGHNRRPNGSVVNAYTTCLPEEDAYSMQVKSFLNTRWGRRGTQAQSAVSRCEQLFVGWVIY